MSEFLEVKKILEDQEKALGEKFTQYETQQRETGGVVEGVKADLAKMAEDHADTLKELKGVEDALIELQQKGVQLNAPQKQKTMGQQFTESEAFKGFVEGRHGKAKVEFKNTIIGETAGEPTNDIVPLQTMPGIVAGAFRSLRVLDVIPQGMASGNTIHYTRELLFTNNAAETAEAAQKPETDLTFEGIDSPVRTIAHTLKVSKQVLDDAPALQSYIDRRMRYGVELRLEQQIINGNGTSPNLSGILDTGNFTSLTAATGDNAFDFANKAKYKVIEADYMADYFLINPADWGALERIKSSGGEYVGNYNAVGYLNNGLQPTLWGLPVVPSNSVPSGTLIALSSDATMFWDRQQTTVEIFNQNEDDVEKNLLTVRGECRGAFSVFRPAAVVAGTIPS